VSCVFCTDVTRAGEVLSEDAHAWVVRHPQGQTMIVAKRHVQNVGDLEEEEWLHLARVWHRVERTLNAERVMVMKLGLQTPHLHVHLFPFPADATREDVFAAFEGRLTLPPR
jgi:diadenosine tetraphosphate (Ap4A) HIT family hydrolase